MQEQELAARKALDTSARLTLAESDIFTLKADVGDLKGVRSYIVGAVAGVSLVCALMGWYAVDRIREIEASLLDVAAIKIMLSDVREQVTRLDRERERQ